MSQQWAAKETARKVSVCCHPGRWTRKVSCQASFWEEGFIFIHFHFVFFLPRNKDKMPGGTVQEQEVGEHYSVLRRKDKTIRVRSGVHKDLY